MPISYDLTLSPASYTGRRGLENLFLYSTYVPWQSTCSPTMINKKKTKTIQFLQSDLCFLCVPWANLSFDLGEDASFPPPVFSPWQVPSSFVPLTSGCFLKLCVTRAHLGGWGLKGSEAWASAGRGRGLILRRGTWMLPFAYSCSPGWGRRMPCTVSPSPES